MALAILAGMSVVLGASGSPVVTVAASGVLVVWVVTAFHMGRAATSPLARPLRTALQNVMPPLAVAAVAVGFLGLPSVVVQVSGMAVVAAAAVSTLIRMVRWQALGPVRMVVVGDRSGLPFGIGHVWSSPGALAVGAAVVEDGVTADEVDTGLYGVPTAVGLDDLVGLVTETHSDAVVVCPGAGFTSADLKRLHQRLERLPVAVGVLGVLDCVAPHRIRSGWVGNATILDIRSPLPSRWVRLAKWVSDRVIATLGLVVTAPVILALVAAVKMTSPGPAFFVQRRVGRGGEPFRLYKLRTMVDRADEVKGHVVTDGRYNDAADSPLFKLKQDPRVTRLGAFMRRYSLDELPQLWNVVKGDMSLVGPRPHVIEETEQMGPDALRRLAVRPGLTGLWQVSGRSDLDWDTSVWLDTYYADNWSVGGDLRIVAKTLPAVVKGRGAY